MENDKILWIKMASLNRTKFIMDIVLFVFGFLHVIGLIIFGAMLFVESDYNGPTFFMIIINLFFVVSYLSFFVVHIVLTIMLFITLGKVSDSSKSEYDSGSALLIFMILSLFIPWIFTIVLYFKLKDIVKQITLISEIKNSSNSRNSSNSSNPEKEITETAKDTSLQPEDK